ncbi:hypothetical protein L1279_002489 [Planomicrobium sp. HSC-17F08]|nr:hypothetical protein [Planomicrobium sp. HSC-17F08]
MSIFNNIKKALLSNLTNDNAASSKDVAPKSFLANIQSNKYYTFSKTQKLKKLFLQSENLS